jgi:hypothetical protein
MHSLKHVAKSGVRSSDMAFSNRPDTWSLVGASPKVSVSHQICVQAAFGSDGRPLFDGAVKIE